MTPEAPTLRIEEADYRRYTASLVAGDRKECAALVQSLVESGADLKSMYVDLFQRSMYEIGELWENNRISVAVEHLATAITQHMLTLLHARLFAGAPRGPAILVACVAGEYHQLGARIVADLCELRGWRSRFMGSDTPVASLLEAIEVHRPALLGLSVSVHANTRSLEEALNGVGSAYPQLPILVGGQAFRWGALDALGKYRNVTPVPSLDHLEEQLAAYEP